MEEIFISQYKEIRNKLKPFDLILFKGSDFTDDLIKHIGTIKRKPVKIGIGNSATSQIFTHVGMIVTSDILDNENVKKGKVYLWDSIISPSLPDILNVEGKSFVGTQLRDIDELVPKYLSFKDAKIAVAPLLNNYNYRDKKEDFTKVFLKYNNRKYTPEVTRSWIDQFCPCFRKIPWMSEFLPSLPERYLFCSELISTVYQDLLILPSDTKPREILPMDFLGLGSQSNKNQKIPVVNYIPVMYIKL